jgi:hypothetical protein
MKRLIASVFALCLVAAPAVAQEDLLSSCATVQALADPPMSGGVPSEVNQQFQFLCGQVVNALTNVQPTLGIAFSGGAHTLGTATTIGRRLGAIPRISVTARVNGAFADAPDLFDGFDPGFDDGTVDAMGTMGAPVGSFQGDVVVGLFNGFPAGPAVGGLGAIDLLGSLSYVPAVERIGLRDEIVNVGVGARVGILKQGLVMPGLSVSGMYRTMLGDVVFGSLSDGDPAEFSSDLSSVSLRAGVSKGILMFDLAAGAGYDIYTSDVAMDWRLDCPASTCGEPVTLRSSGVSGELSTAAWNVYGNVGLNFLLLNVVGELGYQKATDIADAAALRDAGLGTGGQAPTTEDLDGGRLFGSIGLRLTF